MGTIRAFSLSEYISKYDLKNFIETGTYYGDGVAYAAQFPFKQIISFEIEPTLFEHCEKRFKDDERIEIILGDSSTKLGEILASNKLNDNCLFFLDAHFPGADANLAEYNAEKKDNTRLPLKDELIAISKRKNNDVIIIDDLRLFENCANIKSVDQHFKDIGKGHISAQELVHFDLFSIIAVFLPEYRLSRVYRDEGYLILEK